MLLSEPFYVSSCMLGSGHEKVSVRRKRGSESAS
jgi:hypothetical protein